MARQLLILTEKPSGGIETEILDLYTRNILVGIFAVVVMTTVVVGEIVTWAHWNVDTVKSMVQKIGFSLSTFGTVLLGFIYFKFAKKRKRKKTKALSFFSPKYYGPTLKLKK